ncbi:hypothetical protein IAQ61_008994 [Plenodomus lingam]|uniref:uncharacterized protein n=1 Tax=Leptosphaeria maculans TaxID=5022 RepID=UPI00331F3A0C|nr:hypothetical protein IAQ61_008994 [Plenodomus lingam]
MMHIRTLLTALLVPLLVNGDTHTRCRCNIERENPCQQKACENYGTKFFVKRPFFPPDADVFKTAWNNFYTACFAEQYFNAHAGENANKYHDAPPKALGGKEYTKACEAQCGKGVNGLCANWLT